MGTKPLLTGSPTRNSKFVGVKLAILLPWFLLVALLLSWGSDRVPADLHQPVAIFPPPADGDLSPTAVDLPQADSTNQPVLFEVATFNLHRGKGGDQPAKIDGFRQLLDGCDIIALQEDVLINGKTFSRQLGASMGLWAMEFPTEFQWGQVNGGNGLLLSRPPGQIATIPLPNAKGKAFRQIALIPVSMGEVRLTVLATHLDSTTDRPAQWPILIELWKSLAPPCILLGDLNTRPEDPLMKPLLAVEGTEDPLEIIARRNGSTQAAHIDWILTRGLKTISAEVIPTKLSDHPVVRARLEWPEEPKR
ncbi:endonuclease/exonuclease/phosphatase family protein [Planctopirus limnophila]|uniref:endonuclease/exonuclease/phosphatase family protein n=1 Tax=Planctopirus limnophila TaxID=120 RepID=UPI0001A2FC48|nr:endonuclease/exonuclease/phosphatase family protein [Planctopirus limnophila]